MALNYSKMDKKEQEWAKYWDEYYRRLDEGLSVDDLKKPENDEKALSLARSLGVTEYDIEKSSINEDVYEVKGKGKYSVTLNEGKVTIKPFNSSKQLNEASEGDDNRTADEVAYERYEDGEYSYEDYLNVCEQEEVEPELPSLDDGDYDVRIIQLANYLGIKYDDIEDEGHNLYSINGGEEEWYVLTEEEADEKAREYLWNLIDDVGSELIEDGRLDNYINEDGLMDWIHDDEESIVYDMNDDELVEDCLNAELVEEEDVYEVDEEASLQEGEIVYSTNIRDDLDLDDLREQLIEKRCDDIDDPVDYMRWNFGRDWVNELGLDDYIDWDSWIDDVISYDGVGSQIASYDGGEEELGKDRSGNYLYGYRVN